MVSKDQERYCVFQGWSGNVRINVRECQEMTTNGQEMVRKLCFACT